MSKVKEPSIHRFAKVSEDYKQVFCSNCKNPEELIETLTEKIKCKKCCKEGTEHYLEIFYCEKCTSHFYFFQTQDLIRKIDEMRKKK